MHSHDVSQRTQSRTIALNALERFGSRVDGKKEKRRARFVNTGSRRRLVTRGRNASRTRETHAFVCVCVFVGADLSSWSADYLSKDQRFDTSGDMEVLGELLP